MHGERVAASAPDGEDNAAGDDTYDDDSEEDDSRESFHSLWKENWRQSVDANTYIGR